MDLMKRWYKLMNHAAKLNQEAPWIYSDTWYNCFVEDMNTLLSLPDELFDIELTEREQYYFN